MSDKKTPPMEYTNPIIDAEFIEIKESMNNSNSSSLVPSRSDDTSKQENPVTQRVLRAV